VGIVVSERDGAAAAAQPVEIIERKGLGHPDTLCDALAEEVSLALSRFYLERIGFVLHHNVEQGAAPGQGVAASLRGRHSG
jgi:S-adenosylmethionine synthetase